MLTAYKQIGYLHTKRELIQEAHERRMRDLGRSVAPLDRAADAS